MSCWKFCWESDLGHPPCLAELPIDNVVDGNNHTVSITVGNGNVDSVAQAVFESVKAVAQCV